MCESLHLKEQKALITAAHTCPVGKSLHPYLKQTIRFHFEEE